MSYMPILNEGATQRNVTDTFLGYNHNLKIGDGEFYDTQNLTTLYYPLLASRKKRGLVKHFSSFQGITQLNGKLAYVDNGILYFDGAATKIKGLEPGMKQLVTMGAYICIFPDHVYYNTVDESDYGSMTHEMTADNVTLKFEMCNSEGVVYSDDIITSDDQAPENPDDGDLWIDTENKTLNIWVSASSMWMGITQVFTKITFPSTLGIGYRPSDLFHEYDGVSIEGIQHDGLNGSKILYDVGTDYIVVVGVISESFTETHVNFQMKTWIPDMNYVVECQNRLWGCYYGQKENGVVNEIYCCVLGDFKNWNRFLGVSTDSYVASVGTDGPWTGACDYFGYPTFFKENYLHRVSVSATGAHRIEAIPCRGVQPGSEKSIVLLNEFIIYKGTENVCSYQGSFPATISDQFGDVKYYDAVAGGIGNLYYISQRDAEGKYSLFVADVSKGLWMREDDLQVSAFVRAHDELYAVTAAGDLIAIRGSEGELEDTIDWYAESGILYYEYPDKKYISRFNIRMQMEKDAKLIIFIEYDSDGIWHEFPAIFFSGTGTVNIPIRPRRCDHMKIRLAGKGTVKIFSIARILEMGSDI